MLLTLSVLSGYYFTGNMVCLRGFWLYVQFHRKPGVHQLRTSELCQIYWSCLGWFSPDISLFPPEWGEDTLGRFDYCLDGTIGGGVPLEDASVVQENNGERHSSFRVP